MFVTVFARALYWPKSEAARNMVDFEFGLSSSPHADPKLDEHPLSVARNCLLSVFVGIPIFEDNGNFMFGTKFG